MAADNPGNEPEVAGSIRFVQHHLPALEAGDYDLKVAHKVEVPNPVAGDADPPPIGHEFAERYRFAVYGERFAINPDEIDKVFPPRNTQGEYDNVLPHVVIKRRTLPWERTPDSDGDPHIGEMTSSSEADVAPWLALLVLSEAEHKLCPQNFEPENPGHRAASATVKALFPPDHALTPERSVEGTLPSDTLSYFSDPQNRNRLDDWETEKDSCNLLDIPVDLFDRIAPSLADLPWLAHARTKRMPDETDPEQTIETDFAVVVANRLPEPGPKTTVHLVSLERLSAYLPDEQGRRSNKIPKHIAYLRVVSLLQWSFTAIVEKYSFKQLLEELNQRHQIPSLLRLPAAVKLDWDGIEALTEHDVPEECLHILAELLDSAGTDDLSLGQGEIIDLLKDRLDAAQFHRAQQALETIFQILRRDEDPDVAKALDRGYAALPHTTRGADQTVSWYRGPFAPYVLNQCPVLPVSSADAITGFDQETGMFDLSYASAWQIGRLLALSNKHFATEFYYWKRSMRQTTNAKMEAWHVEALAGSATNGDFGHGLAGHVATTLSRRSKTEQSP